MFKTTKHLVLSSYIALGVVTTLMTIAVTVQQQQQQEKQQK